MFILFYNRVVEVVYLDFENFRETDENKEGVLKVNFFENFIEVMVDDYFEDTDNV